MWAWYIGRVIHIVRYSRSNWKPRGRWISRICARHNLAAVQYGSFFVCDWKSKSKGKTIYLTTKFYIHLKEKRYWISSPYRILRVEGEALNPSKPRRYEWGFISLSDKRVLKYLPITVTVKLHLTILLLESTTVQLTGVSPKSKELPDIGSQVACGRLSTLSANLMENDTIAVSELWSVSIVMSAGHIGTSVSACTQ